MRTLALMLVFHVGFHASDNPGAADKWFAPDKAKHFLMAAFIQSASFSALRATGLSRHGSLVGATVTTSLASVGKELYDRVAGGDPSWKDLAWDGAGLLAATAVLRRTER